MSKRIVIRKFDSNNFSLAEVLDEPSIKMIAGSEVEFNHVNINKYYGRLYDAIKGLSRHINKPELLVDEVKNVSPSNITDNKYLDKTYDEIRKMI